MDYKQISKQARKKVLDLIYKAQTSHIGSNFSCVDILSVIFSRINLDKDKFILSCGWKAAALYYFLWKNGRITKKELDSYCLPGSKFIGLAEPIHKDIPFAGGSIGMGLAAGVGFAYSKKLKNEGGKVYVLESDGGMQSGITWEALAFASQHNLDNLILIIDNNGLQAMGKTKDIYDRDNNLWHKLDSFGWYTTEVDGHNYKQLDDVLNIGGFGQPLCIIANTVKGRGVSFMEHNNDWHYRHLDDKSYELAKQELR